MKRIAKHISANEATRIAIVIMTILMAVVAATFYVQEMARNTAEASVEHTYKVTGHIQLLFNRLKDVELGQRGYIVSGDKEYLAPYYDALKNSLGADAQSDQLEQHHSIAEEIKILRTITIDNPAQKGNLDELDSDIQELEGHWQSLSTSPDRPAASLDVSIQDFLAQDQIMGRIRSLIGIMMAEENNLLLKRIERDRAEIKQNNLLTSYGLALFYVIMVGAILLYQRSRMKALVILQESEARLRAVIENAADGLVLINDQGLIEELNPAGEVIFGITRSEARGKKIETLIPRTQQGDSTNYSEIIQDLTGNHAAKPFDGELIGRRTNGTLFDVDLRISDILLPNKKLYVAIIRDISDRKESDRTRQGLIEKLTESNTELERFAYVASHDMQEPLRMITNFSAIIGKEYGDKLDNDGREYLTLVTDSSVRMQRMIQDLLEYARIGNDAERFVSIQAATELKHILANLSTSIAEHKAVVTFDPMPELSCNPVQFTRLLQNLVANSLKYQSKGTIPKIHIAVEDQGFYWRFSVRDNGIGMETEYVEKIFEPFKRLHTWRQYEGTGIGLAICKKIVEKHGGKIWAESTVGEGSIFYFTLLKTPSISTPKN